MINLFYINPSFSGGTTTFTAHLYAGMKAAGMKPSIYRVRLRGENKERPFASFDGVTYRNVSSEEAVSIARSAPSLMTASSNIKHLDFDPEITAKLLRAGTRVVFHSPTEKQNFDYIDGWERLLAGSFGVRKTAIPFVERGKVMPHPYMRQYSETEYEERRRKHHAVSTARVTFVKHTHIILDANRLLPRAKQVAILGAENRMYTKHVLSERYPEFAGHKGFPMSWGGGAEAAREGRLSIDMTYVKGDGGGSQYTFLEAWDAGTVNVVHSDWLNHPGQMRGGVNCLSSADGIELATLLKKVSDEDIQRLVNDGYSSLKAHDAVRVARAYYKELSK